MLVALITTVRLIVYVLVAILEVGLIALVSISLMHLFKSLYHLEISYLIVFNLQISMNV